MIVQNCINVSLRERNTYTTGQNLGSVRSSFYKENNTFAQPRTLKLIKSKDILLQNTPFHKNIKQQNSFKFNK